MLDNFTFGQYAIVRLECFTKCISELYLYFDWKRSVISVIHFYSILKGELFFVKIAGCTIFFLPCLFPQGMSKLLSTCNNTAHLSFVDPCCTSSSHE